METKEFTDIEIKIIEEKLEHPERIIPCPRCGQELIYKQIGNSCEIKCPKENCLYTGIRGL